MKKTFKKLSIFLTRVFKCGCNKVKSRRRRKHKMKTMKIMKGGKTMKSMKGG